MLVFRFRRRWIRDEFSGGVEELGCTFVNVGEVSGVGGPGTADRGGCGDPRDVAAELTGQ
jgi:hypothetical protein